MLLYFNEMKVKNQRTIYVGLIITFVILLASIHANKLIPFGPVDGLDFNNVYNYARCGKTLNERFEGNFYLASGTDCNDVMGRMFVYPPLLFFSANWVKVFDTFEGALMAWRIQIIVGMFICIFIWTGKLKSFLISVPLLTLLMFQYPAVFALERGNNDILVFITWTLGYLFYRRNQLKLSGFFTATSVMMKIYPMFAFFIILCGQIRNYLFRETEEIKNRKSIHFILVSFLTGVLTLILFKDLWYSFYLRVSHFAGSRMVLSELNHSIQYLSNIKIVNTFLFLGVLGIWVLHYLYTSEKQRASTFAGALAVSTYYSATSYDYNLINSYPLIILAFLRVLDKKTITDFVIFFGLVVSTCGHKYLFIWGNDYGYIFRILTQLVFICWYAINQMAIWKIINDVKYMYYKKRYKLDMVS